MKTDLDHLPLRKRRVLEQVVDILLEDFNEKITTATSERRKRGRVLKIILFGSHARGDWVEDRTSGYFSDYDLLIIVNGKEFTDVATYWTAAEDRLLLLCKGESSVPQFIVHTLDEVNSQLKVGQYFFSDIVTDGILLHELREKTPSGKVRRLVKPMPPDEATAKKIAQEYYELWSKRANDAVFMARAAISGNKYNEAAFNLHQATERAYNAYLLTHTLYSPATHNIKTLRSRCEDMEPSLRPIWPRDTRQSRRHFELLKKAYVEARYSKHYKITAEELEWLSERVEALIEAVDLACEGFLRG
ncbi:HEPN domain-containing protein [Amylibacter sp. SFDW26]|nr:HEPN domain-containing protein [Amylibacter sp. SFDW26]